MAVYVYMMIGCVHNRVCVYLTVGGIIVCECVYNLIEVCVSVSSGFMLLENSSVYCVKAAGVCGCSRLCAGARAAVWCAYSRVFFLSQLSPCVCKTAVVTICVGTFKLVPSSPVLVFEVVLLL